MCRKREHRKRPWKLGGLLLPLCCACGAESPAAPEQQVSDTAWFTDITAASGLNFMQQSGAGGDWILTEIMGGGAACSDLNGDGHLDILLLNGALNPESLDGPTCGEGHRLWLGDGTGQFQDVTAGSGFEELRGYAMGVALGDVNGDGLIDVFVTARGRDTLLMGRGGARFEDMSAQRGVATDGWSTSAVFADVDIDGDLDLFVTRYIDLDMQQECRDASGRRTYCPPQSGLPVADVLFLNAGDKFVDASAEVGLGQAPRAGLGVVIEDLNADGRPDIYVANDKHANQLWVRSVEGTWSEEAVALGIAYNGNGQTEASMGVIAEDLDGDGLTDLFMTHLRAETHTLYRSRGPAYVDETGVSGLFAPTMPYTGFGVAAFDLELDGDLDLAVAQGRVGLGQRIAGCDLQEPWDRLAEPNLMLLNDGQGRFRSDQEHARAFTGPVTIDRAVIPCDVDGDGDLDLLVTRIEGPPLLLRNDAPRQGTWLMVDARLSGARATCLGARVTVTSGSSTTTRTQRSNDGYLSARDPRAHFALPSGTTATRVEVLWPDGAREQFDVSEVGRTVQLLRGSGEPR